jgi:hypothetical protein
MNKNNLLIRSVQMHDCVSRLNGNCDNIAYLHENIDLFYSMLDSFWNDINEINTSISKIDPDADVVKLLVAIRDKLSFNFGEPDYFKKKGSN